MAGVIISIDGPPHHPPPEHMNDRFGYECGVGNIHSQQQQSGIDFDVQDALDKQGLATLPHEL